MITEQIRSLRWSTAAKEIHTRWGDLSQEEIHTIAEAWIEAGPYYYAKALLQKISSPFMQERIQTIEAQEEARLLAYFGTLDPKLRAEFWWEELKQAVPEITPSSVRIDCEGLLTFTWSHPNMVLEISFEGDFVIWVAHDHVHNKSACGEGSITPQLKDWLALTAQPF